MKFGHLSNGKIVTVKLPIMHDNKAYYTSDPELLLTLGEKEIVYTPAPEASNKGRYECFWNETDRQIIREWVFVAYTENDLKQIYKKQAVKYIREKYNTSQEFALLREYLIDPDTNKEAFEEYNTYVESCKAKAYAEVYGKEENN